MAKEAASTLISKDMRNTDSIAASTLRNKGIYNP